MTTRLLFKVLNEDGTSCHGGKGRWPLPRGDRPGAALSVRGTLIPCENGLHLCRLDDLLEWLGPAIWLAQVPDGVEEIACPDKVVVRTARLERRLTTWNRRTARLFACDCAEHVLPINPDPRCITAITVARRFVDGKATEATLAAARFAARDAIWGRWACILPSAAAAAARAATWAAVGPGAAAPYYAARDAARDATVAVALSSCLTPAGAAERKWQTERLMQYLRGEVA